MLRRLQSWQASVPDAWALQDFLLKCMLLATHNVAAFLAADNCSSLIKQLMEPLRNTALVIGLNN